MTTWKAPPDVASLNRRGRHTLMSHLGIESKEDRLMSVSRLTVAMVETSAAQAGPER